jgi:segregation and condensation protein A
MDYEVRLEIFEGPLDLLLHLIHKNEVDIFDIPIAVITDQYLEYLEMMKALNINIAGDFLVMASTLVHIKSRMLLPGLDREGEEEADPRLEITRPLLEYMAFREAAEEISHREMLQRDVFTRRISPELRAELVNGSPSLDVNLFQLIDAFKRVLDQRSPGLQLSFKLDEWSVEEKTEYILEILREKGSITFTQLLGQMSALSELVVTFLALLEVVHLGLVRVYQVSYDKDIFLIPSFGGRRAEDDRQTA